MYSLSYMNGNVVFLTCPRCGWVWRYAGTNNYVTSCSKCKTSVSIKKNKVIEEMVPLQSGN